jgi:hypothetical protein
MIRDFGGTLKTLTCHFTYSPYVGNPQASGAALPAAHIWIALEFLIVHSAVITDRRVF